MTPRICCVPQSPAMLCVAATVEAADPKGRALEMLGCRQPLSGAGGVLSPPHRA